MKIIFGALFVPVLVLCGSYLFFSRNRRAKESGFRYVYVNGDGSARELTPDEQVYLNTEFSGGDGARPYIKFRYESLTPDGRISGFLERRQLPTRIEIQTPPNPPLNNQTSK